MLTTLRPIPAAARMPAAPRPLVLQPQHQAHVQRRRIVLGTVDINGVWYRCDAFASREGCMVELHFGAPYSAARPGVYSLGGTYLATAHEVVAEADPWSQHGTATRGGWL